MSDDQPRLPVRLALFVEARADADTVGTLIERGLREVDCPDWARDSFEHVHAYVGPEGSYNGRAFFKTHSIKRYQRLYAPRARGFGSFGSGKPFASFAKKAIAVALRYPADQSPPNAIVVVTDADGDGEREAGLAAVANEHRLEGPYAHFVYGVANRCREAWVLNAFQPANSDEDEQLAAINQQLGFDVTREPERLNDPPDKPRNGKSVVRQLMDSEREQRALASTDLTTLYQRGAGSGLAAFLERARRLSELWRREPGDDV